MDLELKKNKQTTTSVKTVYRENKNHKEAFEFLQQNKNILFKALCNAYNTIKNKKEVLAKDFLKTYYRDYLEYSRLITEMKELFNIEEDDKR